MPIQEHIRRREAMKLAALGVAGAWAARGEEWPVKPKGDPFAGLKVGITSYTTRKLGLDDTIAALKRLEIRYISLKSFHLPLESTREQRKAAGQKIADAGLTLMGCGVISLKNDEAEIRQAFDYCTDAGAPVAVVAPEPDALGTIDRVIKNYPDLRVAIHNHGPEDKKFPSPTGVFRAIRSLDKRIGCCVDVGHTFRIPEDPVAALNTVASRLYDVHLKDFATPAHQAAKTPLGRGVMDIPKILKTLTRLKYADHVALEWEGEENDPVPGMAESFGFVRGVFAAS